MPALWQLHPCTCDCRPTQVWASVWAVDLVGCCATLHRSYEI